MPNRTEITSLEVIPADAEIAQIAEVLAGMGEHEIPLSDPKQATRDIVLQLLAADDEQDLWRELPTWSSKDAVGKNFRILSGSVYPSKYVREDGSKGGFLACRAVDLDSGEEGVFNTSAARVAAKIIWYARHDRLPVNLRIIKRGETQQGYTILDVEKLD